MPRSFSCWSVAFLALFMASSLAADSAGPRPLPRVDVPPELERLRTTLGFEIKGAEMTEGAVGHAGGDNPVERLHLLLEEFDHILVQDPGGGIERVIILGAKSDYVPPPVTILQDPASDEGGADEDEGIVLPTRRKGASHLVTIGLEGPGGDRLSQLMLIDTGADRIVLPVSLLGMLGLGDDELREQQVQTANGVVEARIGTVKAVWLGDQRVEDVEAAFLDDEKLGGSPLLGMSLLGRYRMTIDDEKNQLTLSGK